MKLLLVKQKSAFSHEYIDALINTEAEKICKVAEAKGRHWGLQDMPSVQGDTIAPYLLDLKTKCEQLALQILQKLKPALHLPQGKIDADVADLHHKRLSGDIREMERHINLHRHDIASYSPAEIENRKRISNLLSFGIFIAEVVLNTQAFQVFGDNLIYCLLLACSVSLAVSFGAHFAGRQYKDAKTKIKRRIVLAVSFIGISIFSFVIASLRTMFLKRIGVDIDPLYFCIFNIVFFLMAAIASFYLFPTKEELDQNRVNLHKYKTLKKLEKGKIAKVKELLAHENTSTQNIHGHLDKTMEAEYAIERIKSVYAQAVAIFINANMLCRKGIPDCFGYAPPPLDIPHITFHTTINKYKKPTNENDNSNYSA